MENYRSKPRETHAGDWVFTQIIDGIDSVIFEVGEVSDEEFEICGGNDFEGRMGRVGEINEAFKSIPSLAKSGGGMS